MYSWKLKHILYLDIITNPITPPLRFYVGNAIAGNFTVRPLLLSLLGSVIIFATLRREKEKLDGGDDFRPVLKKYNKSRLGICYGIGLILSVLPVPFMNLLDSSIALASLAVAVCLRHIYLKAGYFRRIAERLEG